MAIPKLTAYALPTVADLPTNKVNWAFEPERAALLIHDMQEYFLNFWGENSPMMAQVVANIARLRDYCKVHNIPVYYTAQPKEQSDDDRALLNDMTPAVRHNDGLDYVPTDKKVLFGHHFAAIAGAGPLVGPVLAAQMGYLPGMIWILAGVVLAGAVQDFMVLFVSTRRDGRSLGDLVKEEMGATAGVIALVATFMIMDSSGPPRAIPALLTKISSPPRERAAFVTAS